MDEGRLYVGLVLLRYTGRMKLTFPLASGPNDSAIRPGFDVLLAVTGARQSASPTARRVAADRDMAVDPAGADQRRQLFAQGRLNPGLAPASIARFADIALIAAPAVGGGDVLATEMNGLFTTAFQPMVKHRDVNPSDMASRLGGAGPGMK